jgi:hypothetical protein
MALNNKSQDIKHDKVHSDACCLGRFLDYEKLE